MFVCCEIEVIAKTKEGIVQCIVQHPGFDSVCLNVQLLQTAFFNIIAQALMKEIHTSECTNVLHINK